VLSRFGYPNDEALAGHPLYAAGMNTYGGYEVIGSDWKLEVDQQNRVAFPDWHGWPVRHFAFVFHDSMFECLAENYIVRSSSGPDDEFFRTAISEM